MPSRSDAPVAPGRDHSSARRVAAAAMSHLGHGPRADSIVFPTFVLPGMAMPPQQQHPALDLGINLNDSNLTMRTIALAEPLPGLDLSYSPPPVGQTRGSVLGGARAAAMRARYLSSAAVLPRTIDATPSDAFPSLSAPVCLSVTLCFSLSLSMCLCVEARHKLSGSCVYFLFSSINTC